MYLVNSTGFVESPAIDLLSAKQISKQQIGQSVLIEPSCFLEQDMSCLLNQERIVIAFDSAADGRAFSLARRLRQHGFAGKIRARGRMFCEQYRYLLECGFDEIEISAEQARRQPFQHWVNSGQTSYRDKLRLQM